MKRSVKSIILLGALVILTGSYFLVQDMNEKTQVSEESGTFALTERTAEELSGIQWSSGSVDYHFTKSDGGWVNANDAAFPVDQEAVQDLADRFMGMEASRKLTEVESLADYGLETPAYTVTAEWTDGSSTIYSMGDETPFADGWYTALSTDGAVVYTAESALDAVFAETLVDLAQQEEIPTVENVTRLVIGSNVDASYADASTTLDIKQHWYDASGVALDGGSVKALIADAQAIEWNSLITASATDAEMAEWQLDANATEISLHGEDGSMALLIGAADADGNYYACLPDSKMVYTVTGDSVSGLLAVSPDSLRISGLIPLEFDNLSEATFTIGDASWTIRREAAEETDTETAGTEETASEGTTSTVTLNGEAAEFDTMEGLWALAVALDSNPAAEEAADGEILLRLTAANINGVSETFTFHACNADSYLVQLSDGTAVLTSADGVDKLIRTIKVL